MVDNDVNLPNTNQSNQAIRRKTLILTRLKQHIQQQQQNQPSLQSEMDSNEIQFVHDRDSFKCSLCYSETDQAPSTSVSTLNKQPTQSALGASNFSFDKEQVLKHVLIVHLSFLAYKCDTCTQFYAFDEPQTKQHAGLVHQCGTGTTTSGLSADSVGQVSPAVAQSTTNASTCHFKLIKTEEEINLAINKAQQFITKIPAQPKSVVNAQIKARNQVISASNATSLANISIEAQPKYKCCRCSVTNPSQPDMSTPGNATTANPIVLYSYQDALDHVMTTHMNTNQNKKDKKLNYELELFEQNLEDLIASETGQVTTVTAQSATESLANLDLTDDEDDEDEEDNGDFIFDELTNCDFSEWNLLLNEPSTVNSTTSQQQQSPQLSSGNRRKRFKTNNNTSLSENDMQQSTGINRKTSKRFYYKPHLVYKCLLCSRKMNTFDFDHWLQHDAENHYKLYSHPKLNDEPVNKPLINCFKCTSITNAETNTVTAKTFLDFTQFLDHYKTEHLNQSTVTDETSQINCLACGTELKCTYVDMLKHFQSEHQLNLFDLKLNQQDLELIHTLQSNNLVQLSQSLKVRKRCFIKIPPTLINPQVSTGALTKVDLIEKELKLLHEIYREQICDKQIVSWLNSEQFLRRNFNYNSYACIICNATKSQILESHYLNNKTAGAASVTSTNPNDSISTMSSQITGRNQYYSDEMKTVVLTNHVLSHFNEYCFRCMSCKISWPDRTQLLKHSQECPNSQVVRTKTKYKLKANCRSQLKFYLQTYIDYWEYEKLQETRSLNKSNLKIYLNDIVLNKTLLVNTSGRFNLNSINLDSKQILLKDVEEEEINSAINGNETTTPTETTTITTAATIESTTETMTEAEPNTTGPQVNCETDAHMNEERTEKGLLLI